MGELKGIVKSWTKLYNTINLQLLDKCLYFKMDGDLLFAGKKNEGGILIMLKSKETKNLQVPYTSCTIHQ